MNSRFPILSALSALMRIVGILFVIGGIYVAVAKPGSGGERRYNSYQQQNYFNQPDSVLYVGGGSLLALVGLGALMTGEVVGVLFAIEQNTRTRPTNAA